ncbi:MAG: NYN domain-containing protein [Deltaproteobacteria bacterium]|jgi:uncharacterized LabA/DUF88 family protein|nr:NYN domain-containing protein [Deltaproteobacteria bacterium]
MERDAYPHNQDRLAVLIDADNAQPSVISAILQEVASLGEVALKRIYGDFSDPRNNCWKKHLLDLAIKPVQQYSYTKGKNATDISLIIDAMDILYSKVITGFCLVSSDSDFTGLAVRLREAGLKVYGFGEEKTPESFRRACNKFILTEYLRSNGEKNVKLSQDETKGLVSPPQPTLPPAPNREEKSPPKLPIDLFRKAAEMTSREDGWIILSEFGDYLNQIQPDFDSRQYGYKKLSDLIKGETTLFKAEKRQSGSNKGSLSFFIHLVEPVIEPEVEPEVKTVVETDPPKAKVKTKAKTAKTAPFA